MLTACGISCAEVDLCMQLWRHIKRSSSDTCCTMPRTAQASWSCCAPAWRHSQRR